MKKFDKVQDSGKRQEFDTGSVRDTAEGKGMPHLIAGEPIAKMVDYLHQIPVANLSHKEKLIKVLHLYSTFVENRNDNLGCVFEAMDCLAWYVSEKENVGYFEIYRRLSVHYENGAKKYSSHNWRKGQPVSRYYDSAMRHLYKMLDRFEDEDHASALLWNLIGIVQTKIDIEKGLLPKKLNDFPTLISEVFQPKEK